MLTLDCVCDFTWGFGMHFLLENTENGVTRYWQWSDPSYYGDNTIVPYLGDPRHFTSRDFMGRCKGRHFVRDYCGEDVQIKGD